MNIAFDATAILGPMSKNRGIGNYALSQFRAMLEADQDNHFFLLNFFEEFTFFSDYPSKNNLKEFYFDCGIDRFLISNPEYGDLIGDIIKKFNERNNIDIFYITSPFDSHIITYKKDWFEGVKVVATVYDIIPYVMKDVYLSDKITYKWYMECAETLQWMDKLLVISGCVKDDLNKYMGINKSKIEVIYGAVHDRYMKIEIDEERKGELLNRYGITDSFIMCTGGDDDRKNMKGLIEAYAKMPEYLKERYQLAIVCKLSHHAVQIYSDVIAKNGVSGRVILTNFVTDEELVLLYNLASLMAFPSKYEGFGMPVVEAFACGTPVLTSNNSSLGEIAKGAAVLVDPFSTKDITKGLVYALTEADLSQNIEKGYEKLAIFQWSNVADITLRAINQLEIKKIIIAEEKKLIAFFTPLPPLESGISDYSVDILHNLSQYVDIDVYIDDQYKPECSFNDNIHVYNHKLFSSKSRKYFDIIYQIGNSFFHTYMYPYIKKYKGTVVLHDYNMHSVAQAEALYRQKNNMKLYKEYLLEDFSDDVVKTYLDDLKAGKTQVKVNEMEINGFITNYAKKIIVHSDEAKEKLLKINIARNVRTIRHYAKISSLPDSVAAKKKYGYAKDDIILSSFGHVHDTKRVIPILNAFNQLCKKYDNVRYLFVGKLADQLTNIFKKYIDENNLENKVTVTGYIDLPTFEDYIDLSDICFNLRHPYNGETSGSLMRILSKGKSVVVNDIGSFGEIPDDCCVKLPNVSSMTQISEIDAIYEAMELLVSKPEKRWHLAESARKYAEEHLDINIIAKQYFDNILEQSRNDLNEEILNKIRDYEIRLKKYNEEAILKISKTLAYIIQGG